MAGTEVASGYVKVGAKMDKGFKSSVEAAMPDGGKVGKAFMSGFKGQMSGFSNWFKGGAVMGAVSSITTAAMGAISSSMDSAIARVDTLANFPKVMQSLGYSEEQATRSTNMMVDAVDGLPTRLQDMNANVQALAATMGNLSDGEVNATSVGKAFNDMMLAGGQGTEMANNAFTQFTQMLAVGRVDQQAWNSVVMAAPGQLDALAKSMLGANANQKTLYEGLKSGKVSFDDFNAAIVKLDKEGGEGFESFETQAKNASTGIGTSMTNARNAISNQMANILGELNKNGEIAGVFDGIKATINSAGGFIVSTIQVIKDNIDVEGFKAAFGGIGQAVSDAFGGPGMDAKNFGVTIAGVINSFIPLVQMATPLVGAFAGALAFLAQNAGVVVPVIGAVAIGMAVIKGASAASSLVSAFGGALTTVGAGASKAAAGAKVAGPSLLQIGGAALMVGAGVALAGAGMMMLANGASTIAGAGPMAAVAMVGMVGAIAALAAGAAAIGPALTAGAVGMVAFGAAVLMVGAGVLLASVGLTMVAGVLPQIAAYGAMAGVAALTLGAGLLVMGAGALVAGLGMTVLGVGLLVAAPGLLMASAAVMMLGAGMMMVGVGAMMAAPAILVMGTALPLIAASAAPAAAGLGLLAGAALMAVPGLAAGAGPAEALSSAIVPMGTAAMMAALGLLMVCASLPVIASQGPAAGAGMQALAQATADATPSLAASAPVMSSMASSITTMANGTMLGAASMAALGAGTQTASAGMGVLDASMLSVSSTASSVFPAFASTVTSSFSTAQSAAQRACASIRTSLASLPRSTTVRINVEAGSVKLPHFSMQGAFNAQTGAVPTVDVKWFKPGAIFKKPVFGLGEAGAEVSMPLYGRYMRPFASAIAGEMGGGGTVNNIEVTINAAPGDDGADLADRFVEELRMYGLMRG